MIDLRQRIKLLMEYDSKLTNSENIEKLDNSKTLLEEQKPDNLMPGQSDNYLRTTSSEPEDDTINYPNYCSYPENAILPAKNSAGVSGEEALIKGFCFYLPGIYLPVDSKITFWDIPAISRVVDKHLLKHTEENKETIIQNFTKIFPIGSVFSFYIKNEKYNPWITLPEGSLSWKLMGWYRKGDNKPYQQPKWIDERNEYQRFIDDYGFAIQISAAVATAVAGALTGGAAWVLTAEILVEAGLGIVVGLRELEKGENVSATLSFITGFLPMLKLSKYFRGIPESEFTLLSKNLAGAGLTKSSTVEDYVKFYNSLPESQQKILSKLLTQDETTRNLILKDLKTAMSEELPELIIKEFKGLAKTNPELLKSIPFFEKLWVRELSTNSFFIVLGIIVNAAFGDILNAEDLEKLSGVYSVVPESLKKEMAFNLVSNAEILPKLANSESFQKIKKLGNLENTGKTWSKYFNTHLKDSIEEAGGKYTELPDNEEKAVEDKVGNKRDEKELRRMGFIPITELTDDQQRYDYTRLNHVEWIKIRP
jgi:hypothetical protein